MKVHLVSHRDIQKLNSVSLHSLLIFQRCHCATVFFVLPQHAESYLLVWILPPPHILNDMPSFLIQGRNTVAGLRCYPEQSITYTR